MTDPLPFELITAQLIAREFDPRTCQRARGYVHAVSELSQDWQGRLRARVQGTDSVPYDISLEITQRSPGSRPALVIESVCSCPVGYRCKHAAAVLMAVAAGLRPSPIAPEVLKWAESLRALKARPAAKPVAAARDAGEENARVPMALHYMLTPTRGHTGLEVLVYRTRYTPEAGLCARLERWSQFREALLDPPAFVTEADLPILAALQGRNTAGGGRGRQIAVTLSEPGDAALLARMAASGRLHYAQHVGRAHSWQSLRRGPARPLDFQWQESPPPPGATAAPGRVRLAPRLQPAAQWLLPGNPPTYVDPEGGQTGVAESALEPELLSRLLALPPLNALESAVVTEALAEVAPTLPRPESASAELRVLQGPPVPVLVPMTLKLWHLQEHREYPESHGVQFDGAKVCFRYGEVDIDFGDSRHLLTDRSGTLLRIERDNEAEEARVHELAELGLKPLAPKTARGAEVPAQLFGLASPRAWRGFATELLPALRARGWHIEGVEGFRHFHHPVEDWEIEVEDREGGYALALGIEVEGRRLDLVPLLRELFTDDPRWTDSGRLAGIPDEESVRLSGPAGERIRMPAGRIKPIARNLAELFEQQPADGKLSLSRLDAPRLAELSPDTSGLEAVRRFAASLPGVSRPPPVPCPDGFKATLRPYQLDGLAWLQQLARQGLGGILADDMGLGKTAQTLAHLLTEKNRGAADRPSLVVVPTSLLFNWESEARNFAPSLRVLTLHGAERRQAWADVAAADLCLTTYPLLWRDEEMLVSQAWHLLILDEAQHAKNSNSRAARVLRGLRARHRLCLTGTPLENHLGELWAQFDFLLPGFLGNARSFSKLWRNPVERRGDRLRGELLARRVRPFVLRRTKEQVARELPPKTVSVRSVSLEGAQRDLYETVRAAMDHKVREALGAQGLARSQLLILDALLKLRQVCCDPRLLARPGMDRIRQRAKLQLLMSMLPALIAEGRQVLVFSQFTSMLDLIEKEVDACGIPHVRLDGTTTDRRRVVERFQSGEVPLFLISLKAGGVGLNLTAADTVIHYDPWWNPAAEAQATDRAHRIGQDKPVLVYKLIVAGSIEERIVQLQSRKAELAASILDGEANSRLEIDQATVEQLMAPLG